MLDTRQTPRYWSGSSGCPRQRPSHRFRRHHHAGRRKLSVCHQETTQDNHPKRNHWSVGGIAAISSINHVDFVVEVAGRRESYFLARFCLPCRVSVVVRIVGQAFLIFPSRIHGIDFKIAIPTAGPSNLFPIWRPGGFHILVFMPSDPESVLLVAKFLNLPWIELSLGCSDDPKVKVPSFIYICMNKCNPLTVWRP